MAALRSHGRRLWGKLGLTWDLVKSMLKNTLPSTAALLVIQSSRLGQEFDTVGFLPIVVTILLTPNLPRIPYLRLFIFTLILTCIVLCNALLAGYCLTQARLHTTPEGGSLTDYNSSAAAVGGVWLLFTVWALQTFRTYKPHRAKSVVICTIFSLVSIVTSSHLPDMASIVPFNLQLFEMFLLGFAFSAFASLFIFPQSSRDVTSADITKVFDLAQKATSQDTPFGSPTLSDSGSPSENSAASHIAALSQTFAKFEIDISDAKKDIGWSHFSPADFNELIIHFRSLIITLRGLFAVETIRKSLYFNAEASEFDKLHALEDPIGIDSQKRWNDIFDQLQEPIFQLRHLSEDAIRHCRISLQMPGFKLDGDKVSQKIHSDRIVDSEKAARSLPGGAEFIADFEKRIGRQRKALTLVLAQMKAQDEKSGRVEFLNNGKPVQSSRKPTGSHGRLLFALYIEHLYSGVLGALQDLVLFGDSKRANTQQKVQVPGKKRMLKLLRKLVDHHHVEGDLEDITSEIPNLTPQRSRKATVEPQKIRQVILRRFNTCLDKVFDVLGSPQSFFGFRVGCAVMSIVIVALLRDTQQWFFNQRGIWAAIFIPFSMAPSSGEAKSMLVFRVLGTLASIPFSLANWYIVNGAPAGVIVFYFVFAFIQQYFLVKFPQWGSFWRPCIITYSVIVGYSLQARYSSTPQPPATINHDYPIYLIGPYRGLCTLVGVGVAYVWTVFPKPTTANSVMRRRLGQALFGLSEYHSCMHSAITSWAEGHHGDPRAKTSVAYKLMKQRRRLFVRETAILAVIRDQHKFASFDISLGGSRPEHRYLAIADDVDRIMSYLNVVIFVSAYLHEHIHDASNDEKRNGPWETGVTDLLTACKTPSRKIASLIHILASSVTNDQPLPPFLESPEPFGVARRLREMRPDLMDMSHSREEGYRAFAVIEISVAMMTKSLDRILQQVRDMVGEVGIDVSMYEDKDK